MNSTMRRSPRRFAAIPAAVGGARSRRVRLKLFELVVCPILEPVGSYGDNEFPVDVGRLELGAASRKGPTRATLTPITTVGLPTGMGISDIVWRIMAARRRHAIGSKLPVPSPSH